MKKLLILVAILVPALRASAQATNPQATFPSAVLSANPSLYLNFNDATTSFKDQVSQNTFTPSVTQSLSLSAPASCVNSPASSSTSTSCTVGATAGDTLIVFYSGTPASITDSTGATLVSITTAGTVTAGYFANVTSGSHVITVSYAASTSYPILQATDVKGAGPSSPIDTFSSNVVTASSTTFTSTPLTTANANEILVGFQHGSTNGYTFTSPVFTGLSEGSWTGIFQAYSLASSAGAYAFTGKQTNTSGYTNILIAVKSQAVYTSPGTTTPRQPGFDSTNSSNTSAEFSYNAWNAAPNTALSTIDWNSPWTMLIHIDRLNWDRTGTLVLASKGDIQGCIGTTNCISSASWWKLVLEANGAAGILCFERNGESAAIQAQQTVCTGYSDALVNGFNYDILIEDSGTGAASALSMYINGTSVLQSSAQNTTAGFGAVSLALSGSGTGYANTTYFTSTGGGPDCNVTGEMISSNGVPTSVGVYSGSGQVNYGCTSSPTIVLTSPTGTGTTVIAAAQNISMNSSTYPLLVPGYVSNTMYYGVGGADSTQGAVNVDEFALFSGNLTATQIANIFYTTKFYQSLLYSFSTPPTVVLDSCCCGPDFSGDQTMAMTIGAAKAEIIKLAGLVDNDGNPNGENSVGWWRQMLDQAGLNDVGVSVGPGSPTANMGGCPAANITAYNASTPQNASSYESSVTMYRTILAANPTTPVNILLTQGVNGYAAFLKSPADSISPLTGLQLQAQNAANGAIVNLFNGNFGLTPTAMTTLLNNNGTQALQFFGGSPAAAGQNILVSRTANDPFYLAASEMGTTIVSGWTNMQIAQILSPYFYGGVLVTYSGGTGYANATSFTSTGGGTYCHVTGIMTASGGVPNGIETYWGQSLPSTTTYNGLGYGCTSAPTLVLTNPTGTGVTLTASPTITSANYGGAGTNQYLVYPNQFAQPNLSGGTAPLYTWFQNSLMDPPTNGAPRPY